MYDRTGYRWRHGRTANQPSQNDPKPVKEVKFQIHNLIMESEMTPHHKWTIFIAAFALTVASVACGLQGVTSEQVGTAVTQTLDALATSVAATQAAGQAPPPT